MVSPHRSTLGELVESVGVGVLDVLVAPAGLDVPIAGITIHDRTEEPRGTAGELLLAVGHDTDEAAALIEAASLTEAAAVVVKRGPATDVARLVDVAAAAGTALLAATDVTWGQLHSLLRTAASAAAVDPPPGGGAPVGDLFALANAVAAMVGGPVTIEDPTSTVLAYSSLSDHEIDRPRHATILGRRVPDEWIERQQADGVFRRLFREPGAVRTDYGEFGAKPRLAIAVRAGDEVLGSIWVQEGDRELDVDAEAALEEAARIAALHLLRHRSSWDLERVRRAELLRAALDGRAGTASLESVLPVPTGARLAVVAFELVKTSTDLAAIAVDSDRAAGLVALYCEAYRVRAAVVAVGPAVYAVVIGEPDADQLASMARGICERATETLHIELRAGVGRSVAGWPDVLASRQEADRVLRALAETPGGGPVATVDSVRARIVLHRVRELAADDPLLAHGRLDVLSAHDRDKGTDYVRTLQAFLTALGDVPAAAAALGVHANTFRYRLRRLSEVAGLDLDDPVERLAIELQLHLKPGG